MQVDDAHVCVAGSLSHVHMELSCVITTRCNPIAETDLASYMLDCIEDGAKWNKVLNIGGPDEGFTMKQQADMMFEVSN